MTTSTEQTIELIDEVIATANNIRGAIGSKEWSRAFGLLVEFGVSTSQMVAFVAALSTTEAGLVAMKRKP